MMRGIDGSHWQYDQPGPECDFDKVKAAGRSFAIWKASEGDNFHDPTLSKARTGARGAGLIFGTYHLGRRVSSGKGQWDFYVAYANPADDELVALDVEAGWAIDEARAQAFINAGRADGFKVGAYGNWDEISTLKADWYWPVDNSKLPVGKGDIIQTGTVTIGDVTYDDDLSTEDVSIFTTAGGDNDVSKQDVLDAFGFSAESAVGAGSVLEGMWDALKGRETEPEDDVRAASWALFRKLMAQDGSSTTPHKHPFTGETGDNIG